MGQLVAFTTAAFCGQFVNHFMAPLDHTKKDKDNLRLLLQKTTIIETVSYKRYSLFYPYKGKRNTAAGVV